MNTYKAISIGSLLIFLWSPFMPDTYSQGVTKEKLDLSDSPCAQIDAQKSNKKSKLSYLEAIQKWKTVYDVNHWIAENFKYDMDRAMQFANSNIQRKATIYKPAEVFDHKKGICVDLSRFAFETVQSVNHTIGIKYLMIDFEPLEIGNSIFRKHWMVVFKENNQFYTMADTKRPGYIGGPYNDLSEWMADYQKFRKRKIISYTLMDTYEKKLKRKLKKRNKLIR